MAPKDRERDYQRRDGRKQAASWGGRQSRRGDRRSRSRTRSRSRRRSEKNSPRRRESRHRDPPVARRVLDKAPEEGELVCDFQPLNSEPPPPGEPVPVHPPWDNSKQLPDPAGQAFGASWTQPHDAREVTPPPHMDVFGKDESHSIPPPQPPSQPPPLPKDAPPPLPSEPPPDDDSQLMPPPPPPGDPPACLPQPALYPASTQLPIPSAASYDQCGWYGGDHRAYAHPGGCNYPPAQPSFHRHPPEQHRRWSYHDNRGSNWGHGKYNRQNQQRGHRHQNRFQNHNQNRFHNQNHQRSYGGQHQDFRYDRPRNQYNSYQNRNDSWGDQGGGWGQDYGQRMDPCMGEMISRMNKDIIEKGTKWLASRWGVKKEDEEGGETLKSRLGDIMLRTMCKENDSDYACSDSEDEHGRRVKPRRVTRRMLSRAWNEIRRRRSSHVQWYNFAKKKGVILKPFPIVPADDSKLPHLVKRQPTKPEKRQPRAIPWSIEMDDEGAVDKLMDPRLVSKTEGQNDTVQSESPAETCRRNGGKMEGSMDTQLQIPNLSIVRFLKAMDRRHKATYKLQYDARVHGTRPPNAPRENPEGSNKFNYINSRAEFSNSTYTLARAQGLTTDKLGNGRLMTFPNSIVVRRDDNLWLHLRERPYHPLELCDRLKTGRPLFSEGQEADRDDNGDRVKLRLYWNTGADSDTTPILARIKVCEKKSMLPERLSSTPRFCTRRRTHLSARPSTPRQTGRKRSLDNAFSGRPNHSEKVKGESTPCRAGPVKEERNQDSAGKSKSEEVDNSHKKKRSRHTEPTQMVTLDASNSVEKPGSQNHPPSIGMECKDGSLAPAGAPEVRHPVVVDVEPGMQHVARLAGTVGMKGVRRVIYSDLSQRLIKSAVQRILSNKEQRAEVAKFAKPKPKPPPPRQSPVGVALTVRTKTRGTPVRRPGNVAGPSGSSPAGRGPTTPVRGRGRGGRVAGGRSGGAVRGRGRGRAPVVGRGRGRGRQAPEKKDQFAIDGASVTEWITSCIQRRQH
ncbi:hypothetical protein BSKO_09975 [Bryopsis sp. KO-2023]|nr:hypothetical protein BSKO_09975 [Bryopsis sp. KO-2023]